MYTKIDNKIIVFESPSPDSAPLSLLYFFAKLETMNDLGSGFLIFLKWSLNSTWSFKIKMNMYFDFFKYE